MKIENLFKITVATIGLSLLFTACQNSSDALNSQAIATADVQIEAEANNITDDVLVMVDETYAQQEFANKSEMDHLNRWMPDCATVTEVVTNTTKDVTIDFGSACVLKNGNTVSGKILMHYVSDPIALTRTINVTFDNFYNNQRKIEGQHTILREHSNSNGNPQATNTESITITWPDGTVASKNGTRIHELIAGADTMAWGDDVLSITGNWTFTRKNGSVHSTTITTALRKELACRFIVSGVVSLENNGQSAVLNYGDGSCDDLATLTKNGVDEIIHLKK
jgi:hypothetical protein